MSQTQKSLVFALVGLVVAGGLALYALDVDQSDKAETQKKEVQDRLFSAAAELEKPADGGSADVQFQALEIHAKGEITKLERKDGQWRLVTPAEANADRFALDAISSQLQTAKLKDKLEENPGPEELKKYGLDKPRFTVIGTARFPDGSSKTLTLVGGIDNPFDGSVYVRRDSDPAVYTAEGGLRYALEKSTFELREKEIFGFLDEKKLERIQVKGPTTELVLKRDDKASWRLVEPVDAEADAAAITTLLAGLKGERAQQFIPDSEYNRKQFGVAAPRVDARFTVKADSGVEEVRVRIGATPADAGSRTFALLEWPNRGIFAEVSASALTALDKSVDDLKDKSLLKFDANSVARITFRSAGGGEPVIVERVRSEDGGLSDRWEVTAPRKAPAKPFKVSSVLWTLGSLKATSFGELKPKDWKKYGIDDSAQSVTLADANGQELARLVRGRDVPDKPGQAYARGSRDQVAELDTSRISELPAAADELIEAPAADAGVVSGKTAP